jgi:uncharacterized membrane protein
VRKCTHIGNCPFSPHVPDATHMDYPSRATQLLDISVFYFLALRLQTVAIGLQQRVQLTATRNKPSKGEEHGNRSSESRNLQHRGAPYP